MLKAKECDICHLVVEMYPYQKHCKVCDKELRAKRRSKYYGNRYKTDSEYRKKWNSYMKARQQKQRDEGYVTWSEEKRNRTANRHYAEYSREYFIVKPMLNWTWYQTPDFVEMCRDLESDPKFNRFVFQIVFDDILAGVFRSQIPDQIKLNLSDIKTPVEPDFDIL